MIRAATEAEAVLIRAAIKADDKYSMELYERIDALTCDEIMIRTDYVSDGPGFVGYLAIVFWGEPEFVTVLGKYHASKPLMYSQPDKWETIEIAP